MTGPIPATSGRILISYRREEMAYPAGRLYDRLDSCNANTEVLVTLDRRG
jgi:hypothetical protein